MTDLFPNKDAIERWKQSNNGRVQYREQPTDIFQLPEELTGICTMFTALHHFKPKTVRRLMQKYAEKGRVLAAFEITERNFKTIFKIMLFNIISGFLVTPVVGKLTFKRAFWTYILPVAPFFYAWDGVISCLRTYTPDDLKKLSDGLDDGYSWNMGELTGSNEFGPFTITYLLGMPETAR
jgi:hypothetical protein